MSLTADAAEFERAVREVAPASLSAYVEELVRIDAELRRRILVAFGVALPGTDASYLDGYADHILTVYRDAVTRDPRLAPEIVS